MDRLSISVAGELLPQFVAVARRNFPRRPDKLAGAVLGAWKLLAGITEWTPEMVDRLEGELAK